MWLSSGDGTLAGGSGTEVGRFKALREPSWQTSDNGCGCPLQLEHDSVRQGLPPLSTHRQQALGTLLLERFCELSGMLLVKLVNCLPAKFAV